MSFQRFKEYLTDKGEVQKKPVVTKDADTGPSGKESPRPPKAVTKGKNWKNYEAAQVDADGTKPVEYSAKGTDPGQLTADGGKGGKPGKSNPDPLAKKGEKDLIYNPKTDDQRLKMKKLHDTTPEETKTEQFLKDTRSLSPEKYAEYVLKRGDAKSVKQVLETVEIIKGNELLMETMVRELKRKGSFEPFISVILNQPETYGAIAARLANESVGKETARQLAKAVNDVKEETEGPASDDFSVKKK